MNLKRRSGDYAGASVSCIKRSNHPSFQLRLNHVAWHCKPLARQRDELVPPANAVFQRRQHLRPERFAVRTAHEQFHHGFIPFQVGQRRGRNGFAKLLGHHLRIGVADAKGNQRAHVAEHRLPDWFGQLVNVLM